MHNSTTYLLDEHLSRTRVHQPIVENMRSAIITICHVICTLETDGARLALHTKISRISRIHQEQLHVERPYTSTKTTMEAPCKFHLCNNEAHLSLLVCSFSA